MFEVASLISVENFVTCCLDTLCARGQPFTKNAFDSDRLLTEKENENTTVGYYDRKLMEARSEC